MPQFRESRGIIYSQTSINIPLDLKTRARALKINLSQVSVAAIEEAVKNAEPGKV